MIAEHQVDVLLDDLFDILSTYLKYNDDKQVEKIYDAIILTSGKFKSVIHENLLGIIDTKEVTLQKNQIGYSLLTLVNGIPEKVFAFVNKQSNFNPELVEVTVREKILKKEDTGYLYDAFLSFSSKDLVEAKHLCEELRGYGLRIFMSSEIMKANIGDSFFEKIDYALKRSQHFILLCTPNAIESEWVKTEYETFYNEYFIKDKSERNFLLFKGKKYSIEVVPALFRRLQFAENTNEVLGVFLGKDTFHIHETKKQNKIENSVINRRNFIITILLTSIGSFLYIFRFKLFPGNSIAVKEGGNKIHSRQPRFKIKKPVKYVNKPDKYISTLVINKNTQIVHYFDKNGYSSSFQAVNVEAKFARFIENIEKFQRATDIKTGKNKPRINMGQISWIAETLALEAIVNGDRQLATDVLFNAVQQNAVESYSYRLFDLIALMCIAKKTKYPERDFQKLIDICNRANDKVLNRRVDKWTTLNWKNKVLSQTKIKFANQEL